MLDPSWRVIQATDLHQAESCYGLMQALSLTALGGGGNPGGLDAGFLLARETLGDYHRACLRGHLWLAVDRAGAMAGYTVTWQVGGNEQPQPEDPLAGVVWRAGVELPVVTGWVYVDKVAVAPAYQRRGVGQALYRAVPPLLVGHGNTPVGAYVVHAPARNEASIRFHHQLGFQLLAEGHKDAFQLGLYWRG